MNSTGLDLSQADLIRNYVLMKLEPKEICKDVTNLGRWGNGDVEFGITNAHQIEDAMYLIQQSFDKHRDED
ncbi:hypothetical protein ACIQD3_09190 [Peribacillus loiseleuriae]|uniref:hypothetical protein n=1 Tax=Peribacillus loiseleuriae TaxID=1679170 RepID=UPI0037F982FC